MKKKLAPIFAKNADAAPQQSQPAATERKVISHYTRPMSGR